MSFIDKHLATIVMLFVMITGQVAGFAVLQSRVTTVEAGQADIVRRSEHMDVVRRVDSLEKEVVPRNEHLLRDTELNKRLDEIQDSIKDVRDRIEVIDNRQKGRQ